MSDERLNGVIDESARRMTAEPPAGGDAFRRRVLARIESGDAPRRTWRAAFALSPIAVAAIVMALFMARGFPLGDARGRQPAGRGTLSESRGERTSPPPVPTVAPSPVAPVARGFQPRGRGPEKAAPHVGTAVAGQQEPLTIDPLAVAPLAVDALGPDSLQIDRLGTITPITVAPLDIGDAQRRFE